MEAYEKEYTFSRFEAMCREVPGNTALYYLGEKFSYRRLHMLIDRFAAGLVEIGVKPQDRVMLYIPNCPQWIIANFAINKIGAVMVPVSPIYTAFEIAYMVEDADIKTIICLDTNFVYVREVMQKDAPGKGHRHRLRGIDPSLEAGHGHALRQDTQGQSRERKGDLFFPGAHQRRTGRSRPKVAIDP